MRRHRLRVVLAVAAAAASLVAVAGCGLGSPDAAAQTRRPSYAVVAQAIGTSLEVRTRPDGPVRTRLGNPNQFGNPLVLLAVSRSADWVKVLLPVRPNGSAGWVPMSAVRLSWDPYRIHVALRAHRLTVFHAGRAVLHASVAVGSMSTPTPRGTFFLSSTLRPPDPGGAYGPYAFGLSGYSPVLKRFAGGPGEIGLHGTNDPASIGRSVTHGCLRVPNRVITKMVGWLPLGTPVVVDA